MHTLRYKASPVTGAWLPAHRWLDRRRRLRPSAINYYDVLEIDSEADPEQIKTAFRQKAKQLHPDVNQAADADQAFRQLKIAHEVLSNKMLRMDHDSQLGLPSARAADPRFARFERWRREVVPDLRMQMDVWGAEVYGIITAADEMLWKLEQQQQQAPVSRSSTNTDSCAGDVSTHQEAAATAAALAASMQGVLQDATANVQRLYDKRYQQVEVRYPAYPSLVWFDVWEELSGEWLAASQKLQLNWKQRVLDAEKAAGAAQATAAAAAEAGR